MNFDDLMSYYKSQVAAAEKLNVTQPTISNWKRRGRIPSLQQLRIQKLTRGKLQADPKIVGG